MPVRTEVTTGVFDPRTYKMNDEHWARRRKSSWLAWPGTIKYTRERTVEGEEEEGDKEKNENDGDGDVATLQEQKRLQERGRKGKREIKINIQKKNVRRTQSVDIWPRRTKTDITELLQ